MGPPLAFGAAARVGPAAINGGPAVAGVWTEGTGKAPASSTSSASQTCDPTRLGSGCSRAPWCP